MGKISLPAQQKLSQFYIDCFLGADLTNQPSYIAPQRSPDCVNMIRESSGKVRKWIGYKTVRTYSGAIHGCHRYMDEAGEHILYHAGTKLYHGDTVLYEDMADKKSVAKQLNEKLYIFDGKTLLVYLKKEDAYHCVTAQSIAYVPTIFISKSPKGGGVPYEPINLLSPKKTESFLGNATDKSYQLAATEIDAVEKIVKVTANGETTLVKGTDYTVNTTLGIVHFTVAHAPVVAGEDNIKITYSKVIKGYAERIYHCDVATLYGVSGARDRLFCGGSDEFSNRDYYSQLENGLYFGDVWYMTVGADNSKIMGYSIINDKLATHLDYSDDDTNIILRSGNLNQGEAAFVLSGSFQGSGAISKHAFGVLETEPLFLTENGVYAVTPSDILGERYAQLRSYYLNGLLLKQDLKNAVACTYDRFYMLAVGPYIFALDGTQASREQSEPYSNRQYAGFYRDNVNATCMWVQNGALCFGTADGKIKQFYTDYTHGLSFNDDGAAINAKWTTPEIYGSKFYAKKKFKRLQVLLAAATATGVKVTAVYDGIREVVKAYGGDSRYFAYSRLTYSKFSYKTDRTAQHLNEKISIKPENKKIQFVYENENLNEPLGLYAINLQFTEG